MLHLIDALMLHFETIPSRTTLWRWKTKGRPTKRALTGRRPLDSSLRRDQMHYFVAILIEDKIAGADFVDHVKARNEFRERMQRPLFYDVLSAVWGWKYPI